MLVSKHFYQRRTIQGGVGFSPIVVSVQTHLKFGNQIWEVIICAKYRCVKQRLVVHLSDYSGAALKFMVHTSILHTTYSCETILTVKGGCIKALI